MKPLTPQEVLEHPSAPYWVKKALSMALLRDPQAAADEATLLADVLRTHLMDSLKARSC